MVRHENISSSFGYACDRLVLFFDYSIPLCEKKLSQCEKSIHVNILKCHLKKIREEPNDYAYVNGVVLRILPLIRYIFPDRIKEWEESYKSNMRLEDHDTFLRIRSFGANIPYWQYVERKMSFDRNLNHSSVWIFYAYLCDLERDWLLSRDFFRSKILYHESEMERPKQFKNKTRRSLTKEQSDRDLNLLDRYMGFMELKFTRGKVEKQFENWIYNRAKIKHALNVICQDFNSDLADKKPISVELDIIEEGVILCLKVKWCSDLIEIFKLHRFQESDSPKNVMQAFASKLIYEAQASIDPTAVSGANVDKYLQRLGIRGVLAELLILEKTKSKIILEDKEIMLENKPFESIDELLQYSTNLEFLCWEFD